MNSIELKKKIKNQQIITALLIGLVILMFVYMFIINPENSSTARKILPFALLPLVATNIMSIQKLNQELKSRQNI